MTETAVSFESLLKARTGTVEFVHVPEFGFAMVTGVGAPDGAEFTPPDKLRTILRQPVEPEPG